MTWEDALPKPLPDSTEWEPLTGPSSTEGHEFGEGVSIEYESGASSRFADLVDRSHRLDAAYVSCSRLSNFIANLIFAATAAVGCAVFWFVSDTLPGQLKWAIVLGVLLTVLVLGLRGYFWPALELERTRWRVGAEGIEIKRGVLFRHVVTVPRNRIQHTDVAQGPVQRRFGLATLSVHTAGTHEYEVTLSGVQRLTALEIRDYLLEDSEGDGA